MLSARRCARTMLNCVIFVAPDCSIDGTLVEQRSWNTICERSALGQKQTLSGISAMSALPPKADMCGSTRDVRFGPIAEIVPSKSCLKSEGSHCYGVC